MRNISSAPGEYYHLFNRGMSKQNIFFDKNDWVRFLFLILHLQSPTVFQNIGRPVKEFVKHSVFNTGDQVEKITANRYVTLATFCLMPNHFHLIIKEEEEGGIATYMQRILNGYTKYINTKYKKTGHLFQGPYKIVHVESDRQLLYLSAYIHKNPRELKEWRGRENHYPWSSYKDFDHNRWPDLLVPNIIVDSFRNKKECKEFIQGSTAKTFEEELDEESLGR
ncbi:MAG: transposase [Patescibacteria group bacterium]|nr:transposase [Patescibacteria group bacterium]